MYRTVVIMFPHAHPNSRRLSGAVQLQGPGMWKRYRFSLYLLTSTPKAGNAAAPTIVRTRCGTVLPLGSDRI